ncbi:MAG: hypothetical protein HY000_18140 [Planctomycetes bacterium]|nr:hypothetical protein [Planctomycetota bacterium]
MHDLIQNWDDLPEPLRKSLFLRVFRELYHVQDNPRLLILISHGFIELLVNALIDAKCKNAKKIISNSRDFPHSAKLVILHEMGVITDFRFKSLDWFRKLRNRAAHEPLFEVTPEEIAAHFNQTTAADRSIVADQHGLTAHGFAQLCVLMIVTLWSDHSKLFSPVFVPQDATANESPSNSLDPNAGQDQPT